jgi:hypothetical protein
MEDCNEISARIFLIFACVCSYTCIGYIEAHQGDMTDRRHSLKRGDRLSKKERQTTASDWGNCDLCYGSANYDKLRFVLWVGSDSDIYYNKTSDKAATK